MKSNLLALIFLPIVLCAAAEFLSGCDSQTPLTNSPDYNSFNAADSLLQQCEETMMLAQSTCTEPDHMWTDRDHEWCSVQALSAARAEDCFWAAHYGLKCMEDFFMHYDDSMCADVAHVTHDMQHFCVGQFESLSYYHSYYGCPLF